MNSGTVGRQALVGIPAASFQVKDTTRFGVPASYVRALQAHGAIPVALPPGNGDIVGGYLDRVDGLLIPGGTDVDPAYYGEKAEDTLLPLDPALDSMELALIRGAFDRDIPILAICRGIQSLAVALGGTLIQDLPKQTSGLRHEVRENGRQFLAHGVKLDPSSRLSREIGREEISVNSFHHQAVRELPDSLSAVGWSDDGVIEAVEGRGKRFVVALQCHPEEMWDSSAPEFSNVFTAFVDACREQSAEPVRG